MTRLGMVAVGVLGGVLGATVGCAAMALQESRLQRGDRTDGPDWVLDDLSRPGRRPRR